MKGPGASATAWPTTDSSPAPPAAASATRPAEGEGTYSFYTRATDKAGNVEVPPGAPGLPGDGALRHDRAGHDRRRPRRLAEPRRHRHAQPRPTRARPAASPASTRPTTRSTPAASLGRHQRPDLGAARPLQRRRRTRSPTTRPTRPSNQEADKTRPSGSTRSSRSARPAARTRSPTPRPSRSTTRPRMPRPLRARQGRALGQGPGRAATAWPYRPTRAAPPARASATRAGEARAPTPSTRAPPTRPATSRWRRAPPTPRCRCSTTRPRRARRSSATARPARRRLQRRLTVTLNGSDRAGRA